MSLSTYLLLACLPGYCLTFSPVSTSCVHLHTPDLICLSHSHSSFSLLSLLSHTLPRLPLLSLFFLSLSLPLFYRFTCPVTPVEQWASVAAAATARHHSLRSHRAVNELHGPSVPPSSSPTPTPMPTLSLPLPLRHHAGSPHATGEQHCLLCSRATRETSRWRRGRRRSFGGHAVSRYCSGCQWHSSRRMTQPQVASEFCFCLSSFCCLVLFSFPDWYPLSSCAFLTLLLSVPLGISWYPSVPLLLFSMRSFLFSFSLLFLKVAKMDMAKTRGH